MIANNSVKHPNYWLIFGIPILLITTVAFISGVHVSSDNYALALVVDLLLTVPLMYFLLIRKTKIPRTTVLPVLILGLVVGTFFLPAASQKYLDAFRLYVLPFIELTVLSMVIYKVYKARRSFKENPDVQLDYFSAVKSASETIVPKRAAHALATEIAIMYYGFYTWKKRTPAKNAFTYHRKSGVQTLMVALLSIVLIETFVLHIILEDFSFVLAWVLSILSIYTALQLLGMVKSFSRRFIRLEGEGVFIPHGIMSETFIPYENIESVELSWKSFENSNAIRHISPLGSMSNHNTLIHCKLDQEITGLYGMKKNCQSLALFVDDKHEFKKQLEDRLSII